MCIDTLLKEHGWVLVIWSSKYDDSMYGIIGPNAEVVNHIKDSVNCIENSHCNTLKYLTEQEDIPFVIAEDVATVMSDIEDMLNECCIEKCSWRNRTSDRLYAVALLFGYME